jgi:sulfate transport system substrate-binding protein
MLLELSHALRHLAGPLAVLAGGLVAAAALLFGAGGASDDRSGEAIASGGARGTVALVGHSTPQVVYDEVIPAFQRTAAGREVGFRTSFGASGDQSRAVAAGLDADLVTFSLAPDVDRLVEAGMVAPDWRAGPAGGLVSTSVVSFVVREGNPKGIRTWADLLRPGVEVLTPSPLTSGAAKWNLLAAYGQASGGGKDPEAGLAYVRRLLTEHVAVQDKSAREALQSFTQGRGDVLLSYEYEAVTARREGERLDHVVPDDTIRIEIPLARTRSAEHASAADAFRAYVLSAPAQRMFAEWGYRPVDAQVRRETAARFPRPARLFTVEDLGGWAAMDRELFDPRDGAVARITGERR